MSASISIPFMTKRLSSSSGCCLRTAVSPLRLNRLTAAVAAAATLEAMRGIACHLGLTEDSDLGFGQMVTDLGTGRVLPGGCQPQNVGSLLNEELEVPLPAVYALVGQVA